MLKCNRFSGGLIFVIGAMLLLRGVAWAQEKKAEQTEPARMVERILKLPDPLKGGEDLPAEREAKEQSIGIGQILPPIGRWIPFTKTYSVFGTEFDSYHEKISWGSVGGSVNRYVRSCGIAVCGLEAPIHIPDGARITGYRCKVLDNSSTHPVKTVLIWTKGDGFAYSASECHATTSTTSASSSIRSISSMCSLVVDNSVWAYAIRYHTYEAGGGATICENGGSACRIYNCYVSYQ